MCSQFHFPERPLADGFPQNVVADAGAAWGAACAARPAGATSTISAWGGAGRGATASRRSGPRPPLLSSARGRDWPRDAGRMGRRRLSHVLGGCAAARRMIRTIADVVTGTPTVVAWCHVWEENVSEEEDVWGKRNLVVLGSESRVLGRRRLNGAAIATGIGAAIVRLNRPRVGRVWD